MAIIGMETACAALSTIYTAIGRIAGPLKPPLELPKTGLFLLTSMTRAAKVLTRLTASAPASWAARAMTEISVTFGESLAITGSREAFLTSLTTRDVDFGSCATKVFFPKFGQDRLSSRA